MNLMRWILMQTEIYFNGHIVFCAFCRIRGRGHAPVARAAPHGERVSIDERLGRADGLETRG